MEATGNVTSYGYDLLDNLINVTNGGQSRSFTYSLSHLASANNPESGYVSYTYDANGNLVSRMDARDILTCFGTANGSGPSATCTSGVGTGYDALNRPLKRSYTDGTPAVTFTYDTDFKGALAAISNSVSTTSFTHDGFGRIGSST